jgi:hypothetical protein
VTVVVQLQKQLTKPGHLRHVVGHGTILHLNTRTRDNVLMLRGPGDKVVIQEHHVARSGPASVGTTNPVNVSVDDVFRRRGVTKKQVVIEGALEVVEDALCGSEMLLMRVVHVKAHLLDCVTNVKPGEGELLESLGQVTVGSWIADRGSRDEGDLGLIVHRHGAGLAVAHASALKDIPSILA